MLILILNFQLVRSLSLMIPCAVMFLTHAVMYLRLNLTFVSYFIWLKHDDVIKWKHFPRYWPFVRGIQLCPVNSLHKGHWRGALMFSLVCVWINGSVNSREAGDFRRHRAHYGVIVVGNQTQLRFPFPILFGWKEDYDMASKICLYLLGYKIMLFQCVILWAQH